DCWATRSGSACQILLTNYVPPGLEASPPAQRELVVRLTGLAPDSRWQLTTYRIDAEHANPLAAWLALGSPDSPTPAQLAGLRAAAELRPSEPQQVQANSRGALSLPTTMLPASVTFYELLP
ncbi:MAG TPA: hypothetical protein VND24_03605, partial [Steroidobacteraceae bacterium]|nr:hypothetical protein [Steroidobacteraceae bacterium]